MNAVISQLFHQQMVLKFSDMLLEAKAAMDHSSLNPIEKSIFDQSEAYLAAQAEKHFGIKLDGFDAATAAPAQ